MILSASIQRHSVARTPPRAYVWARLSESFDARPPHILQGPISYLARRLLAEVSVELRRTVQQIAPNALALLEAHPWPGNVRELRSFIRQAVLMAKDLMIGGDVVRALLGKPSAARHVAVATPTGLSLREVAADAAEAVERRAISEALRSAQGNKIWAARALDTDSKTLHLKMKRFGIRGHVFIP